MIAPNSRALGTPFPLPSGHPFSRFIRRASFSALRGNILSREKTLSIKRAPNSLGGNHWDSYRDLNLKTNNNNTTRGERCAYSTPRPQGEKIQVLFAWHTSVFNVIYVTIISFTSKVAKITGKLRIALKRIFWFLFFMRLSFWDSEKVTCLNPQYVICYYCTCTQNNLFEILFSET